MALISRRQFVQQTALTAATLWGSRMKTLAGSRHIVGTREQSTPQLDHTAIQKLASEIAGHVITPETSDYEASRLVFNRAFDLRPD